MSTENGEIIQSSVMYIEILCTELALSSASLSCLRRYAMHDLRLDIYKLDCALNGGFKAAEN